MKKTAFISSLLFALPAFAFAQTLNTAGGNIQNIILWFGDTLNLLIPVLIAAALVAFFWGLVTYVWGAGGEGAAKGKSVMIAGLLALFVMVSVWGIIKIAQNTFGVGNSAAPQYPQVPR
ncbi:MAG TPA: hypothetical protein VHD37_03005 [Candidatus Paceibacterota bacterium]|nr:hypothetical protein [Candidatus Paceibacterota bacterium]